MCVTVHSRMELLPAALTQALHMSSSGTGGRRTSSASSGSLPSSTACMAASASTLICQRQVVCSGVTDRYAKDGFKVSLIPAPRQEMVHTRVAHYMAWDCRTCEGVVQPQAPQRRSYDLGCTMWWTFAESGMGKCSRPSPWLPPQACQCAGCIPAGRRLHGGRRCNTQIQVSSSKDSPAFTQWPRVTLPLGTSQSFSKQQCCHASGMDGSMHTFWRTPRPETSAGRRSRDS